MLKHRTIFSKVSFSIALLCATAPAQQTGATALYSYEIVSVRPSAERAEFRVSTPGNAYTATATTLPFLIHYAYNLRTEAQLTGLPDWARSSHFDVHTKMDEQTEQALGKLPSAESQEQRRLMMRQVLAERFHLQVHNVTRDLPIYTLNVAKGGFKLAAADPANTYKKGFKGPDGQTSGMITMGNGRLTAQAIPASSLAIMLASVLNKQVVDKTGLTGTYDVSLHWNADELASATLAAEVKETAPSLFTALQEQLGLKLESTRGPVDTIVVDHIELPTEN